MCLISLLLQERVVQMGARGETCLWMTHVFMYNHEFTYICHTRGLHWQHPAILKPTFMKGRLENKQSKFSTLLSLTRVCPFSTVRLTYWLSSKNDIKGSSLVVIFWEFCFPCVEKTFAFTPEKDGRTWRTNTGSRSCWYDFVEDHPMVRCGIGNSLSEVLLWSSLETHAANIRGSVSSRFWECIKVGVPLSSCVSMFVGICIYEPWHALNAWKKHRGAKNNNTSVQEKTAVLLEIWRSCVPHLFILHSS